MPLQLTNLLWYPLMTREKTPVCLEPSKDHYFLKSWEKGSNAAITSFSLWHTGVRAAGLLTVGQAASVLCWERGPRHLPQGLFVAEILWSEMEGEGNWTSN